MGSKEQKQSKQDRTKIKTRNEQELYTTSKDYFKKVGHYTAVLRHRNGQWTEIDDLQVSEKPFYNNNVIPHVLIYREERL